RNLGVRDSEEPGDLLGQRLIGGKARKLVLPEIEITPGQPVEIGLRAGPGIVAFGSHAGTITHGRRNARSQPQRAPCRTAASALRFSSRCKRAFTSGPGARGAQA